MSFTLPVTVGAAYAIGLVGFHRWSVYRTRKNAHFYPTLEWIDWDTVFSGLLSIEASTPAPSPRPYSGGPPPRLLSTVGAGEERKRDVLAAIVTGADIDDAAWSLSGLSGGEARWLRLVTQSRRDPERVLDTMEQTPVANAADAYWRALLSIRVRPSPLNVEWFAFTATQRLNRWIERFADAPGLYFARAKLAALLGRNGAVLNDLARAVYFSREAPFYLHAVTESGFVDEVRPALAKACRAALERQGARELPSGTIPE